MQVLYFAHLKTVVAKEKEQIELHNDYSVLEFKQYLYEMYPNIKEEAFQIAVNEEIALNHSKITNDDIVALIPPVSGG